MSPGKKRLVFLLVNVFIISMASFSADAELVGYWKLDETAGSRAIDSSRHGNDGTLLGELSFEAGSAEGVVGKALRFDGKNDRLHVDGIELPGSTFTIAFFFSPDVDFGSNVGRVYVTFWGGPARPQGDKPYFAIGKGEGAIMRLYLSIGDDQHYLESLTESWKASKWYHVAAVFDRGYAKLFINGILESSDVYAGSHYPSRGVFFGGRRDLGSGLKGRLDDIRLYDEALTDELIRDLAGLDPAPQRVATAFQRAEMLLKLLWPGLKIGKDKSLTGTYLATRSFLLTCIFFRQRPKSWGLSRVRRLKQSMRVPWNKAVLRCRAARRS